MLVIIIITSLLLVIPPIMYFAFRLGRTIHAGPWTEDFVMQLLEERVEEKYNWVTISIATAGYFIGSFGAFSMLWLDFAMGAVIGFFAYSYISKYNIRSTELRNIGPDESITIEEIGAPNDPSVLRYEGKVPPLPIWKDMLFLYVIELIGALIGFGSLVAWDYISK
ncbi:MAG: hypothetical protein ACYC0V_07495 [Armatimonadota bacterium]